MSLRFVNPSDASSLLHIYEQSINTPTTFESILPTQEEFLQRIVDITAVYPYLVWEENGSIFGYAYAHKFKERSAYQWSAELSIYIDSKCQSMGVGKRLYAALIAL
ncbi:MAG TPA: GNAT family N-acetyltransferase [Lachnospiraceae bacterium]|nr:GNAT family N-acetyltransferase [Lachnospiraceae bacterium]